MPDLELAQRMRCGLRQILGRVLPGTRAVSEGPLVDGPVREVTGARGVTENFLVCLETGTRHVVLSRHLRETLHMSPEEYRARWGLPEDYPMVAASYARRRNAAQNRGISGLA